VTIGNRHCWRSVSSRAVVWWCLLSMSPLQKYYGAVNSCNLENSGMVISFLLLYLSSRFFHCSEAGDLHFLAICLCMHNDQETSKI